MKIEVINWLDALGDDGWVTAKDLDEITLDPMETVGFVYKETKEFVLVTMTYDEPLKNYGAYMCIPKKMIVSRKIIK